MLPPEINPGLIFAGAYLTDAGGGSDGLATELARLLSLARGQPGWSAVVQGRSSVAMAAAAALGVAGRRRPG